MYLPLITLGFVLLLVAARGIVPVRFAIWQVMSVGAIVVLAGGAITPMAAWRAIDWDVILFLFGVFVVGQLATESGYLQLLSARLWCRLESADGLVFAVIVSSGIASALLMNDTLAIVATPLVLSLARQHGLPPTLLLLALAFGVTTGSVVSPIGNPQNLLIAMHGHFSSPFLEFGKVLLVPTVINLMLAYVVLRWAYSRHFHSAPLRHCPVVATGEPNQPRLARVSLLLLVTGVCVKLALALVWPSLDLGLTWIALLAAAPGLAFSRQRLRLLRSIDWGTLVFFIALFVLMTSVWDTGFVQHWLGGEETMHATSTVFALGIGLSQLITNVPLVSLYMPLLDGAQPETLLSLAAASTIAGNLLIFGAASNVIIIQRAERHGATIGFVEFARVGVPLTVMQALVYWWWLS